MGTTSEREMKPRRLSLLRIAVAALLIAAAASAITYAVRQHLDQANASGPQWFAPYIDATLTPLYPFEDAQSMPSKTVVLGFVVSTGADGCQPSWGAANTLDQAATSLDLDRRIIRMRQHGGEPVVSFGGAANTELAVSCKDGPALSAAYRSVIDRYSVRTVDFDVEGAALDDMSSITRRAAAIKTLQDAMRSAGTPLSVWLTLPVAQAGLPANAIAVVDATLAAGVDLAGVNAMTMDYGNDAPGVTDLRGAVERSLKATGRQLGDAYSRAGQHIDHAQAMRKLGATPMIGLNDSAPQQFSLDAAHWLVSFARSQGLGRLSMWSLNRDNKCNSNVDTASASPYCSGIDQSPRAFAQELATFGAPGPVVEAAPTTTTASASPASKSAVVDDQTKSPYPIWSEMKSYQKGRKVVWHGNVYESKWYTRAEAPDAPVANDWDSPWRLVGPLLPSDHPAPTTTLAPGTYPDWSPATAYDKGSRVEVAGIGYEAKWWTHGDTPGVEVPDDWDTPWQAIAPTP